MKTQIEKKEIEKVAKIALSHCQKIGFYVQEGKLEYFNYTGHIVVPSYIFLTVDTRGLTVKKLTSMITENLPN